MKVMLVSTSNSLASPCVVGELETISVCCLLGISNWHTNFHATGECHASMAQFEIDLLLPGFLCISFLFLASVSFLSTSPLPQTETMFWSHSEVSWPSIMRLKYDVAVSNTGASMRCWVCSNQMPVLQQETNHYGISALTGQKEVSHCHIERAPARLSTIYFIHSRTIKSLPRGKLTKNNVNSLQLAYQRTISLMMTTR